MKVTSDIVDPEAKIIVYDAFDNVIRANLAKLKLDAYGIPCFLTDENFVNLYPIRNEVFPGVRLHIFEKDLTRVKEVLAEDQIAHKGDLLSCPRCKSTHILFEETNKNWFGRLLILLSSVLLFEPASTHRKKIYRCQDCQTEF